jgi:uncharacterized protein (TIGR02452 family)
MGFSVSVCFRKPTLPEKPYFFRSSLAKVLSLAKLSKDFWENYMGKIKIIPGLDSPEMGFLRQKELDIPRAVAFDLGNSAVQISRQGYYLSLEHREINIQNAIQAACEGTQSIPPDSILPDRQHELFAETKVQVTNETTLAASRRLTGQGLKPLALNFANGIHPGGGFLHGARAQEEALCRSSALYQTLVDDPMYDAHKRRPGPDSTDWAIYSPSVPVFRSDDGTPLSEPWLLSFITCAAPYAPSVGLALAGDLLQKRIHRVLAISLAFGYSTLVLGAWGCGAFGNDPSRTARDFRHAIENEFSGSFSEIIFAITDWSDERSYLGPFRAEFS